MPYTASLSRLHQLLREYSPLALAFSGGLDSRFLAHTAQSLASEMVRIHLFHIQGSHVPAKETKAAIRWAKERALALTLISVDPLAVAEVRANNAERCYHCKGHLFAALLKSVQTHPFFTEKTASLCDGTNADDLTQYRPGLRALRELGIRSPLAEAGIGKNEIRTIGAATGLDHPEQKARPCLLTRFAYDLSPTAESLAALDAAEQAIQNILTNYATEVGLVEPPDFRLRLPASAEEIDSAGRLTLPFTVELHISEPPSSPRSKESKEQNIQGGQVPAKNAEYALPTEALFHAVIEAGFRSPAIIILPFVQGYYDKKQ